MLPKAWFGRRDMGMIEGKNMGIVTALEKNLPQKATDPPLLPMPGEMLVEHLHKAHLDHLTDKQGHIVNPLRDDHQVAFPKDFLGLLR